MLPQVALFLAAAVVFVPLLKRAKLGAVLGYLAAGMVIGPHALGLAGEVDKVLHASEFGVVLLLFVIGLELQPSRLRNLRRDVFGLGSAQLLLTTGLLAVLAHLTGLSWTTALVLGAAMAMSSTALALQVLAERHQLSTQHGRKLFAILLFQDLAVIPLLALVPLLAPQLQAGGNTLQSLGKAAAAIVLVILLGRTLLKPALRWLATTGVPEVFTAAALLLVIGVGLAMQSVGLSMALGAFLAGVLLAESEYRHELQADLEPFKGLLLGLFFIAVGMNADIGLLKTDLLPVLGLAFTLLTVKAAVLYGLGRWQALDHWHALRLAGVGSQVGEFAFVLIGLAATAKLLPESQAAIVVMATTLTMIASPVIYAAMDHWLKKFEVTTAPFDEIQAAETPVVIAGFGPFGQIIGRILRLKKITFTVLDSNADHVAFVRSFGNPVFFSDAARTEVLRAAHVRAAKLMIIAISDEAESLRVMRAVRSFAPNVRVMAAARTRQHALALMELGVAPEDVIRRSYFSSLKMTEQVLVALGNSADRAKRAVQTFHVKDSETLMRQKAVPQDDANLRATAAQINTELEELFAADEKNPIDS